MTAGTMHLDRVTGRLLLNGVPVCAGCLVPSDAQFCRPGCAAKVRRELRRQRKTDRPLVQTPVFAAATAVAA